MTHDPLGLFLQWRGLPPEAREHLDGWRVVAHEEHGEVAAIAVLLGSEIHFAVAPAWRHRFIQRARLRGFLAPLMAPLGFLTTRTLGGECRRFLERLGFVRTWDEGDITYWMLTALPFGPKEH